MAVPAYQTIMRPILEFLSDGQDHGIRDVYGPIADRLGLTEDERQELIPSGTQRLLDNRVGWAKTYLLKAGLLESPRRGVVRLTDRGRKALASTDLIDRYYLRKFPEFLEFLNASGAEPEAIPPDR